MANYAVADQERMRRFRDAALPHLDDIYTLARYLMRNSSDADDAVQECYLRASNCACGLTNGCLDHSRITSLGCRNEQDRPLCGAKTRAGRPCRMRVEVSASTSS
jgi:Sigma-70 region 2